MTSARTERETLDAWDAAWDESDTKARELLERFEGALAEKDEELAEEFADTTVGRLEKEASWMREPNGEKASTIFQTVREAGAAEDMTFTDKAVMRQEVVDMMTRGIPTAADESDDRKAQDLVTNGKRMMDRGLAMGAEEVFYRGIADVRAGQKRAESGQESETDDGVAQGRADLFKTKWEALVAQKGVATELSISDDRALSTTLREMKAAYDEVSARLSTDDQYAVTKKIAEQFTSDAARAAEELAAGENGKPAEQPGAAERTAAERIAAGVIAENIRESAQDLAEALAHVDRRMVHDAGREAAWAIEDLEDLRAGRQVSTVAFQRNREADRQYTELWEQGRRAA